MLYTLLFLVVIIDTVSGALAAYSRLPSGLIANPNGWESTAIEVTSGFGATGSSTDTLLEP